MTSLRIAVAALALAAAVPAAARPLPCPTCGTHAAPPSTPARTLPSPTPTPVPSGIAVVDRDDVDWGPMVDGLPPGGRAAVVQGNPSVPGSVWTVRVQVPSNYTVPPHFHPTTEVVTVLAGSLYVGDGDVVDRDHAVRIGPGGITEMPPGHHHWVIAGSPDTELQITGLGPFGITYVNPADDPRRERAASIR